MIFSLAQGREEAMGNPAVPEVPPLPRERGREAGMFHTSGMETGYWCDVLAGTSAVQVTRETALLRDFTPHRIPARSHSSLCMGRL